MEYTKEQNRAVKEGVDAFFGSAPMDLYARPVESADDLLARGLVDETGTATPRGVLFTQLQDAGMFDERGAVTPKAQAYAMTYDQVVDGGDGTLGAYRMRMEDGIDKPQTNFDEQVSTVWDMVWDAGKAAGNLVAHAFDNGGGDRKKIDADRDATLTALVEGSMKATFDLMGMADVGMTHLSGVFENDLQHELNVWRARQQRDKIFNDNQTANLGETAEDFLGVADVVDRMAQAKEALGKERFDAVVKQGAALGEFTDATTFLPMGAAAKVGKLGVITRAGIKADKVLAKTMIMDARIAQAAVEAASATRAADALIQSAQAARKLESDLLTKFELTGAANLGDGAKRAGELAARHETTAANLTEGLSKTQQQIAEWTEERQSIATRIPEAMAQTTQRAIEIGKAAKSMPVTAVAAAAEKFGTGLINLDEGLTRISKKFGIGAAYDFLRSGIGQAGMYATAATFNPVFGAVGSVGTVLRSGGALQGIGKYGRVVGKELSKARGQVPFWQRVANHPDVSPAHRAMSHLVDTMTAGGAVNGAIRRTGRGVLGAYPLDLAFEYLADDGAANGDTFKRAFAESLVIGGSTAALGGAFMGTKARHRELALGDEANFRSELSDPIQRTLFNAIPNASRRAIATYAASNPQLNFRFTNQGSSSMLNNTATINVASNNPLKALIGHEVMHNVVIRNQMEEGVIALMIGDGEAGGLLRSSDGTLDKNFEDFMSEYQNRIGAPVDLRTAALEYFVDASADRLSDMAESGELGALAGRTEMRRSVNALIDAVLPKIPLIRDLHFKMGGLMEQDGKMVMGSGLLAEGIRELPQVKTMAKAMLSRASGRSQGLFQPVGQSAGSDGGVALPIQKGDKHLLDKMVSIFETEEINGQTRVKYDTNGDPIPLSPAKDLLRSKLGVTIGETLDKLRQQGKVFREGELRLSPEGTWEGNFLGEDVIREIEKLGILNNEQVRMLKNLNRAAGAGEGDRFIVINHPAIKKIGKKLRYGTMAPTLRDVSPSALMITKDGNLIVGLLSVTQLMNNIDTRAASKRGRNLYQGNKEAILNDVSAVMELHRKNQRTDAYFDEKYGPMKAKEYKNFINTLFGLMTPAMADVNPLFDADKVGYKENVYKTYRLDRISQATRMSGDTHVPMPLNYDAVKLNLMPNGEPTLDETGRPVARSMPENEEASTLSGSQYRKTLGEGVVDAGTLVVEPGQVVKPPIGYTEGSANRRFGLDYAPIGTPRRFLPEPPKYTPSNPLQNADAWAIVNRRMATELEIIERLLNTTGEKEGYSVEVVNDRQKRQIRVMLPQDLADMVYKNLDKFRTLREAPTLLDAAVSNGTISEKQATTIRKVIPANSDITLPMVKKLNGTLKSAGLPVLTDAQAFALGDLYFLRNDTGLLGDNGKTGASTNLALLTCHPTEGCANCYAAKQMSRPDQARKAIQGTIRLYLDPEAYGRQVAAEAKKIKKTQLPFIRMHGSGEMNSTEHVRAFNEMAKFADRPIHVFSRKHDLLGQLKDQPNAPFFRMGSLDGHLVDSYGVKFLSENMNKRGISNAFLYSDPKELPALESLYKKGALGLILSAKHSLHDGLPSHLKSASCPCDAGERSYVSSCRACAMSNAGCFMAFSDKGVSPDGKMWSIMDPKAPDGLIPMTAFVPEGDGVKAWEDIAKAQLKKSKDGITKATIGAIPKFKEGARTLRLQDIRRNDALIYSVAEGDGVFHVVAEVGTKSAGKNPSSVVSSFPTMDEARSFIIGKAESYVSFLTDLIKRSAAGTFWYPGGKASEGFIQDAVYYRDWKPVIGQDALGVKAQEIGRFDAGGTVRYMPEPLDKDGNPVVRRYLPEPETASPARGKPVAEVVFAKPIKGPTGSEITSYAWRSKLDERANNEGEMKLRRVSDWDQAISSAETGKDIVHQFVVKQGDETKTVSLESALSILGFTAEQAKPVKSLASTLKTYGKLRMQISELESVVAKIKEDRAKVDASPIPEITTEKTISEFGPFAGKEFNVYNMDGAKSFPDWNNKGPDREALKDEWRILQMRKLGWGSTNYEGKLSDAKKQLKKIERKIAESQASSI